MLDDMRVARPSRDIPRLIVRADGAVVCGSGLALAALARPLTDWIGVGTAISAAGVGAALAVYGGWLYRRATRQPIRRSHLLALGAANSAWTLASLALAATNAPNFTPLGRWLVAAQALAVAAFAVAQLALTRCGD